jgi:hypothetical protein
MQKVIGFLLLGILALSASAASASQKQHLDKLNSFYPYGLLGDDYGILTLEDLAVNTCNMSKIKAFSLGEGNMNPYPYWQCFPLTRAKLICDSMGYDPVVKKETGYMSVEGQNENGFHSYLARDAQDMRDCKKYLAYWKKTTRNEKYVCVSGPYVKQETNDGRKETHWILDKFKTRKDCVSSGGNCHLKEIHHLSCEIANDPSLRKYKYLNDKH